MKRYPEYKESGVEWLGEVPAHWSVTMLKHAALVNPTKGLSGYDRDSTDKVTFLPMEKVSDTGHIETSLRRPVCDLWSSFTYFEEGDVIVAKITPCFENGKGAFLSNLGSPVGFGSTEFHVLRPREEVSDAGFLYYLTYSDAFRNPGKAFMTGAAGQQRVPTSFVEEYHVALPTLTEQRAIAAFLDRKTEQIDTLIEKKRRLIELLKEQRTALINRAVTKGLDPNVQMKDSGIEWLGEVPEHWEVPLLKYVATLQRGHDLPTDVRHDGEVPIYTGSGITGYHNVSVDTGPGVITGRYGTIGDVHYAEGPYWPLNTSLYVVDFRDNLPRFVFYLMHVVPLRSFSEKSAVPGIDRNDIHALSIPVPPFDEQKKIASSLDHKMIEINDLQQTEDRQINLLTELRSSLISEVVTGKIDVRGWDRKADEALEAIDEDVEKV